MAFQMASKTQIWFARENTAPNDHLGKKFILGHHPMGKNKGFL